MDDSMRSCRRTGCRWPAVASLSYRYDTRQVWLVDLDEPHPSLYDLCPHHADTLTVPRGWERVDQRSPEPEAVVEPAGRDLVRPEPAYARAGAESGHAVSRATTPRGGGSDARGGSRYSLLRADLPRLAAEFADQQGGSVALAEAERPVAPSTSPAPPSASASRGSALRSVAPAPLPSRDLSPMPTPAVSTDRGPLARPGGDELAGQLAIPVDDAARGEEPRAVVVALERAGGRRRSEHSGPRD